MRHYRRVLEECASSGGLRAEAVYGVLEVAGSRVVLRVVGHALAQGGSVVTEKLCGASEEA